MVIPGKHLVRTVIPVRPSSQLILAGKFQAHMMILDKLQKQLPTLSKHQAQLMMACGILWSPDSLLQVQQVGHRWGDQIETYRNSQQNFYIMLCMNAGINVLSSRNARTGREHTVMGARASVGTYVCWVHMYVHCLLDKDYCCLFNVLLNPNGLLIQLLVLVYAFCRSILIQICGVLKCNWNKYLKTSRRNMYWSYFTLKLNKGFKLFLHWYNAFKCI